MKALNTLGLDGTGVKGAGLAHLDGLPLLRSLSLGRLELTAEAFAHLAALPALAQLNLIGTCGDLDSGMEALAAGGCALNSLFLQDTPITDAGLSHLARLAGLQTLVLRNCKGITDAGLLQLKALNGPRAIILDGCSISAGAKEEFLRQHPGCRLQ